MKFQYIYGKIKRQNELREVVNMDDMQNIGEASNASVLEQIELIEHWDNPVIVLMPKKDEFFIDGNLELFLSAESFTERIREIPKEQKMVYSKIPVVIAISTVCKNDCKGMLIRGFEEGEVYITREELMPLKDAADMIHMLQALKVNQLTQKRVCQLLKDKTFYMLGDTPSAVSTEEDLYSFDMTRIKGKAYDAVKLYMTKERAEKYNVRNFEIHGYTFGELAKKFRNRYGLVIEPQQGFATAFAPDEI